LSSKNDLPFGATGPRTAIPLKELKEMKRLPQRIGFLQMRGKSFLSAGIAKKHDSAHQWGGQDVRVETRSHLM
jgi:hypothetical protein